MLAPRPLHPYPSHAAWDTKAPMARSLRELTPSLNKAAHGGTLENRRDEIRRTLRLGCRARKVGHVGLVGDRTLDLSPQGMLLLSDEPIEAGTQLAISFFATELPIWFDTRATVTRVVRGRRPGDPRRALGLRFHSLPAVSRLILRGHLRRYPPTLPQRKPCAESYAHQPDYAQIVKEIYYGR
jgi:hypothetical protein